MTATSASPVMGAPPKRDRRRFSWVTEHWLVKLVILVIVIMWLVPTVGLLITSLRPTDAINSTGWWKVFPHLFDKATWTLSNYSAVLSRQGFGNAFLNSLAVTIPSTVIPITIAAFAAYAFAWMDFKGRYVLFVIVVGLLVVPLQMALIPVLRLYTSGAKIFGVTVFPDLNLNGTYLAVWLAHTGFGLPLAVYLLRNYIGSLPSSIIESARIGSGAGLLRHFPVPLGVERPAGGPDLPGWRAQEPGAHPGPHGAERLARPGVAAAHRRGLHLDDPSPWGVLLAAALLRARPHRRVGEGVSGR
jgi:ABC-type glycerol-3-phosphate transport system permease component